MYLGIDVGATKTLFAVFNESGKVLKEHKIQTSAVYEDFKSSLAEVIDKELAEYKFSYCCAALPAWFDFEKDVAIAFGNLSWENIHFKKDLSGLIPGVAVLVHNDAKLAALSEAILLHKKYKKVLYLTVSTGTGGGIIINDVIDEDFANFEPGQMVFEYNRETKQWEDIASGRVLKEKYGKLASEIDDEKIWKEFTRPLAIGLQELLATIRPDVVIIGGGMGAHFEKFKDILQQDLEGLKNPMVPIPPLLKAKRPEEAVIYGCYDYIKQNL